MPELPEVETIKRELEKKILGKKITEVKVIRPKVIKEPSVDKFEQGLTGEAPEEIIRKAKVLIIKFGEQKFLIIHLRITGWLLYGRKEEEKARLVFRFSDASCLNYMDSRLLGELRLRGDWRDLKFIQSLGPEPFEISLTDFGRIIRNRTTRIKVLLLDQSVIAGIGNIYAQEALFLAGIDPRRPANSLRKAESKRLYQKIISVLEEGIKFRGSSVDSYRNTAGDKGGMEERLKVYGRKKEPCRVCGRPLQKIALGGRGTCFCPHCQK